MKKVQIRKVISLPGHIRFEAYQSHERCHIRAGMDEPEGIVSVPVEFIGDNYRVIGCKTELEAIRGCLDSCIKQGYEVDSDIPAFRHNAWDGTLERLIELDLHLSAEVITKEKVCLQRQQELWKQMYKEHFASLDQKFQVIDKSHWNQVYRKHFDALTQAFESAIALNPDYYGKDFHL